MDSRHDLWDYFLLTDRCDDCKCAYKRHQVRMRAAWVDCDHAQRIPILCVVCLKCNKFHTVLPDFLKPHRRYITPVFEAVVIDNKASPFAERTAYRWRSYFPAMLLIAISSVIAKLLKDQPKSHHNDERKLKDKMVGVSGLRKLRVLAQQQGRPPDASGLLGWFNREFGQFEGWAL